MSNIECEYESIETYVHSEIADRGDFSTLVKWALSAEHYSAYGNVVERFVAIVDYLCYVAEIYENNGRAALVTLDPKPCKIIENELIVPITTRSTTLR